MKHLALLTALFLITVGASPPAASAQDADALAALEKLHARYGKPDKPLSIEQGKDILSTLESHNLGPATVDAEHQPMVLAVEVAARLAVGDAGRAEEYARALLLNESTPDTKRLALLAAVAAGDAQFADEAVKLVLLNEGVDRKQLAQLRRGLIRVASPAPDATAATESGAEITLRSRNGRVLLVHFWTVRTPPADAELKALKSLYGELNGDEHVQFLSVNADATGRVEQARKFADEHGIAWPQHYERKSSGAPLTHDGFKVGSQPVAVVVDQYGYIRAVGDAADAGLQYALRSAAAEARGDFPPLLPRDRDGTQVEKPAGLDGKDAKAKEEEEFVNPNDLPSDPEAASMIRQARAYIKTGLITKAKELLEEVIRRFPGTREAADAKYRLEAL